MARNENKAQTLVCVPRLLRHQSDAVVLKDGKVDSSALAAEDGLGGRGGVLVLVLLLVLGLIEHGQVNRDGAVLGRLVEAPSHLARRLGNRGEVVVHGHGKRSGR